MTTQGETDDIKDEGELSKWLVHFGLTKFDSALRDEGIEDFQIIKTIDDETIDDVAKDVGMKKLQKKALIKGVKAVRDGTYPPAPPVSTTQKNDPCAKLREGRKDLRGAIERKPDPKTVAGQSDKKIRTVIFIGQTGAGKTTLINSMINYLHKVSYDESFRYQLIVERKNKKISKNQTKSQTQDITQYYLRDLPAVNHSLNVIDTPGFGDTEGPQQDLKIRTKFKQFFKKIDSIDGIYFVVKASDTRLGATQKYIFNMVLDLFGADVEGNIFILFTFSDGAVPPALKCVKELGVPFSKYFQINNSGFGLLTEEERNPTHEMFYGLGTKQFDVIFEALGKVKSKSVQNSRETLEERENITTWLFAIGQSVKTALDQINEAHKTYQYLQANKHKIDANKDHKIPHRKVVTHEDPVSHYTTYCITCVHTCHRNCGIPNNDQKKYCSAMRDGYCTVCDLKCKWRDHENRPYVIRRETVIEMITKKEMAEIYNMAKAAEAKCEDIMKRLLADIDDTEMKIRQTIVKMRKSVNRLQEIALNKKVLTDDEYFDTLIASEKDEGRRGWENRVKQLESMKKDNKLLKDVVEEKEPISWKQDKDLIRYQQEFAKQQRENKPKQSNKSNNKDDGNVLNMSVGGWTVKIGKKT